jgi:hypothetical protein
MLGHLFEKAFGGRGEQAYEMIEAGSPGTDGKDRRFDIGLSAGFDLSFYICPVRPPYFVKETHLITSKSL